MRVVIYPMEEKDEDMSRAHELRSRIMDWGLESRYIDIEEE